MIQYVDVQKSVSSTSQVIKLTVNLGVFCPQFAVLAGDRPQPMGISSCHWWSRLGSIMPHVRQDQWWLVSSEQDACTVADQLVSLIDQFGLPSLEAQAPFMKLAGRWLAGDRSGLTAYLHEQYCQILRGHPDIVRAEST